MSLLTRIDNVRYVDISFLMPVADNSAYRPMTMIVPPDVDEIRRSSLLTLVTILHHEEGMAPHIERAVILKPIHDEGILGGFLGGASKTFSAPQRSRKDGSS